MANKHFPYNGTRIFVTEPLVDVRARARAWRNNPQDPLASRYAHEDIYDNYYKKAQDRLAQPDMITVDDAAKRLGITPAAYIELADKGKALLVEVEGVQAVPAWQFTPSGHVDQLKLDIAREFVLEGKRHAYFAFMDFFEFMTETTVDISSSLSPKKLADAFKAAGVDRFNCTMTVLATMNQLIDMGGQNNAYYRDAIFATLQESLTKSGMGESWGGLSRTFMDLYNIPGKTIEEEYTDYYHQMNQKNKKAPKP